MTPDTFGVVSLWSDVNPILVAVYHGPQSENHLLRPNEDCRWYAVSPIFSSLCQTVFAWKLLTAAVIVGSCMVLAKSPFTILLRDLSEESNTCHLSRDFSWISCQPLLDGFNYWKRTEWFLLGIVFGRGWLILLKLFPHIKNSFICKYPNVLSLHNSSYEPFSMWKFDLVLFEPLYQIKLNNKTWLPGSLMPNVYLILWIGTFQFKFK